MWLSQQARSRFVVVGGSRRAGTRRGRPTSLALLYAHRRSGRAARRAAWGRAARGASANGKYGVPPRPGPSPPCRMSLPIRSCLIYLVMAACGRPPRAHGDPARTHRRGGPPASVQRSQRHKLQASNDVSCGAHPEWAQTEVEPRTRRSRGCRREVWGACAGCSRGGTIARRRAAAARGVASPSVCDAPLEGDVGDPVYDDIMLGLRRAGSCRTCALTWTWTRLDSCARGGEGSWPCALHVFRFRTPRINLKKLFRRLGSAQASLCP